MQKSNTLYGRHFWQLFIGHSFFCIIAFSMTLLSLFIEKIGGDKSIIGIILACLMAGRLVFRPLWGTIIDNYGRKANFLLSGILLPITLFSLSIQTNAGILFAIVCFLYGAGIGGLFSTFFTYVNDLSPSHRRSEVVAIFGLSGFIGMALGPMIGNAVVKHYGFESLLKISSILAIFFIFIPYSLPETLKRKKEQKRVPMYSAFKQVIKIPSLLPFWSIIFAFGCSLNASRVFLATMAKEFELGSIAQYFTTYALTAIIVRLCAANLADKVGKIKVLIPAVGTQVIAYFILTLTNNPAILILSGFLGGLGHAYIFPILNAMVAEEAGAKLRGMAVSCFSMTSDIGSVFGSIALGVVAKYCGYLWLFRVVVCIIILGVIPLLLKCRSTLKNMKQC